MVRVKGKGDLYVHQDANWNVIGLILDTTLSVKRRCRVATRGLRPQRRVKERLVERHLYTLYGELTVHQAERDQGGSVKGFGNGHGDGDP